ncbi:ficolin-1-like [Physella acuta]|uniref:ficolin-1-like n=1 Tax=Physella acuta TaxID=109671 RepID=UPI0027DBC0E3|nr:ficolin-1-like [Physella acuta]
MSAGLLATVLAVNFFLCSGYGPIGNITCFNTINCDKSSMYSDLFARIVLSSPIGRDVLCDTKTDGGGWIMIVRRSIGDVVFSRGWAEYKYGFGTYYGDYWMGLEQVHQLTMVGRWELRVDIKFKGKDYYAKYDLFEVENEAQFYKLHVGDFSGNVSDGLSYHDGMRFYTSDKPTSNDCSRKYSGGWWFQECHRAYLTGVWGSRVLYSGIHWYPLSPTENLDSVEMKMRKLC